MRRLIAIAMLVTACGGTAASAAPTPSAAVAAPSRATYYHASQWVPIIETMAADADCAGLQELQDTIVQADVDVWKALQDGLASCAGPTPSPTDISDEPKRFQPGDPIDVTSNDEPWATITISGVKQVKKYDGEYLDDKPAKGNIYIQLKVTYLALTDGVDYNPFDWQVFVAGEAVDDFTYVSEGPTPELGSGTLPEGRKASGWLVYEVPIKGEVLLSYGGSFSNEAPVFEVVLRKS